MRNPWSRGIPLPFILIPLAAVAAGVWWWQTRKPAEPFQDSPRLEYADYLERSAALRGSRFSLLGTIDRTLIDGEGDSGRIIVVIPEGRGSVTEGIPVKVPPQFLPRLQVGRRFWFLVTVADAGALLVQDLSDA